MRKGLIVGGFAIFAVLSLLILPVVVEAVRYGDLEASEALRAAAIFIPTGVLGWFAWRHVGPLPVATQERLVRVFDAMTAAGSDLGPSQPIQPWDRDPTIASMRMRSPAAARRFFRPDPYEGFEALYRDAVNADEKGLRSAPDRWRDLGVLQVGLDDPLAFMALNKAKRAGRDDYLVRIALHNFNAAIDDWEDARQHAQAALEKAVGDVQQLGALIAVEEACVRLKGLARRRRGRQAHRPQHPPRRRIGQ